MEKDYNLLWYELNEKISAAGLKNKIPLEGSMAILTVLGWYILGLYSLFHWHPLLTIALFVIAFFRATYVAHDVIHQQYYENRKWNKFWGYVCGNVLIGVSANWWHRSHNLEHHTYTNSEEVDKDINGLFGFFAGKKEGPSWLHTHKHIFFWTFLPFVWLNFHINSWHHNITQSFSMRDIGLMFCHLFLPVSVLVALPFWAALGVLVSIYGLFSIFASLGFATNHLGMEIIRGDAYKEMHRFDLQTRTSRNVSGGMFVHWLYGGLNTQIEHHLWPKVPRLKLLQAATITGEFCKEHGITYHSVPFWRAYGEIYGELKLKNT